MGESCMITLTGTAGKHREVQIPGTETAVTILDVNVSSVALGKPRFSTWEIVIHNKADVNLDEVEGLIVSVTGESYMERWTRGGVTYQSYPIILHTLTTI